MRMAAPLRIVLLGLVLAVPLASAQAPPAAKPNIIRLEPKAMEGLEHGRAVVVKGKVGPEGHRFLLDQLNMMMPVTVALRPTRRGDEVRLQLSKYAWNQPLRDGETSDRILKFQIRTESEFQITVTGEEPGTPYRLLVWVGDEVKPQMRPVVVKASEFKQESGDWGEKVLWVIAGLLLVGIVLLAVLVFRRKSP